MKVTTIAAIFGTLLGGSAPLAEAQALHPCQDRSLGPSAQCGAVLVWENRAAAIGRRLHIHFAVFRARAPGRREPVFLFAGGPGQGSTELADMARAVLGPVLKTRDIVMVDQRGTGGSNLLRCVADVVAKPQSAFGHVFDPALFAGCRGDLERHADLRFYTTEIAVEDVDDVRAALSYDRVIVWGGSYGTRIAQAYVKAHPDRVTAAVLDGVVPFDFRAPAGYAASVEQSLQRVFADCAAYSPCATGNPDLAGAFGRLMERFAAGPVTASVRRPDSTGAQVSMSLGDFRYAVRGLLYSSRGARALPGLIHRADSTGDLSDFAQAYWSRAADFAETFADGLHFAIFCAEDVPFIRPAEIPSLVAGSFMGTYLADEYRTICDEWVRAPIGPHTREPLQTGTPTVLFSGWFDPVTPPDVAERVAEHLPNSRHIVVRNEAHGAGFGCARPAMLYVLTEGKVEGMPSVCGDIHNLWDR